MQLIIVNDVFGSALAIPLVKSTVAIILAADWLVSLGAAPRDSRPQVSDIRAMISGQEAAVQEFTLQADYYKYAAARPRWRGAFC
jgi:hypothetical protein